MVSAVEAADQARISALTAGDADALRRSLHPDLTYIHSHGQVDDLTRYLSDFSSGIVVYDSVGHDIEVTTVTDGVALAVGVMSVAGKFAGRQVEFRSRTMSVWESDGQTWRLRGFHSSRFGGRPGGSD
ncbi:hypothetical protein G419_16710 [Rhodococcus triatomae BKS 15-14]|nr:hypothetical protein G419_16710 [Rhodococcus triatomae BKS 15-14]